MLPWAGARPSPPAWFPALGKRVKIFMPDWMSRERRELIRSFRAEIVGVNRQQGGFLGSIQMAEEFAANGSDVFLPRQFSNDDNSEALYQTTGPETWSQPAASALVWNLLLQADPRGLSSLVEQQDSSSRPLLHGGLLFAPSWRTIIYVP